MRLSRFSSEALFNGGKPFIADIAVAAEVGATEIAAADSESLLGDSIYLLVIRWKKPAV